MIDEAGIPRVTYCEPEVASVGLTEAQAKEKFGEVQTLTYDLAGNGKIADPADPGRDQARQGGRARAPPGPVVGIHMVGARVGELIGEAQLVYNWDAQAEDVAALVHAHPTQNEAFGEAHLALAGKPLHATDQLPDPVRPRPHRPDREQELRPAMAFTVQMPALGESVTEGTVTRWLKQEGDRVEVDEPLLEVSTDKVDTEIPSPAAGVLQRIVAGEDETVEVGGDLAVIGDGDGDSGGVRADARPIQQADRGRRRRGAERRRGGAADAEPRPGRRSPVADRRAGGDASRRREAERPEAESTGLRLGTP